MSDDRRHFSRVPFDAPTRLLQADWQARVELLDLSLRGLLVLQPENWAQADPEQPLQVIIELSELERIHLEARTVFTREGLLGLQCQHLDLDSISHLKRLLMLNLGDDQLAHRELAALLQQPQEGRE